MKIDMRQFVFAGAVGIAAPAIQAQQFVQMGNVPGQASGLLHNAITDDGEVLGLSFSTKSDPTVWAPGIGYSFLPPYPATAATIESASDNGERLFGVIAVPGGGAPVMWSDRMAPPILLDGFPAGWTCNGILCNFDGTVAIGSMSHTQTFQSGVFIWRAGQGMELITQFPSGFAAVGLGNPSDDGKVAFGGGRNASASSFQAVRWVEGKGIIVLGCPPGAPLDCALGGTSWDGNTSARDAKPIGGGERQPVYWNLHKGWTYLGTLPGHSAGGSGLFSDPWVVAGATFIVPGNVDQTAFLWNPLDGMRPVKEILEQDYGLNVGGWDLFSINAMSRNGRYLSGLGFNLQGQSQGWWAEIVPFCYADCDRDKQLTFFDFLCYINHFDQEDIYSNCNNDGAVDFFDFLCFINKWQEGCP